MKLIKTVLKNCKKINTLILNNNNKIYGTVSFINKNNTTIINNLYINPLHTNNGYASKLLKETEIFSISNHITKHSHNSKILTHEFKLCVWEPTDKPHAVSFLKNRGYDINSNNLTKYYDDGDRIFELIEMSKKITIYSDAKN
jgi:hypothetical protein